jgi:DNA gyrase subunit A
VNAIRLQKDDHLAGLDVINAEKTDLLVVTARGYGKRISLGAYRLQARRGMGRRTIATATIKKFGPIVSAQTVNDSDEITLITRDGMALRTRASTVRPVGRFAQGVRMIRLWDGDQVVSVAVVEASQEEQEQVPGANGHDAEDTDILDLPIDELIDEPIDELVDEPDDEEDDLMESDSDSDSESSNGENADEE